MHVAAVVVAAGASQRIGGETPKIYLPLAGRPMLLRTLDRVFATKSVEEAVVVVAANDISRCAEMLRNDAAMRGRSFRLQIGGATRQQSVQRGLQAITRETEIVVIHDGARPFVSAALIDRCVESAAEKGAVVVGLPVRDTIKVVGEGQWIQTTPDRRTLWEIQTPQVFQKDLIVAAHARAEGDGIEATDDAMVVERFGKPVFVIEGEKTNLKITLPEDIWLAGVMIREGRVP